MFRYLYKKFKFIELKSRSNNEKQTTSQPKLSKHLKDNLDIFKNILGLSTDIIYREFSFGSKKQINAAIIYLEGMTEKSSINEDIIKPLMYDSRLYELEDELESGNINAIKSNILCVGNVKQASIVSKLIDACLSGDTVFLIDGSSEALIISSKGWETRSIEEPKTEVVVRGPREGFSESIATNMTLIRRKIKILI